MATRIAYRTSTPCGEPMPSTWFEEDLKRHIWGRYVGNGWPSVGGCATCQGWALSHFDANWAISNWVYGKVEKFDQEERF